MIEESSVAEQVANARREMRARIAAGASLRSLEDFIVGLSLPDEETTALVKWAEAETFEPRIRRKVVFEPLTRGVVKVWKPQTDEAG